MKRNFFVATVQLLVPANDASEAIDAVGAALTENLQANGEVQDWGYIGTNPYYLELYDVGEIDTDTYKDGEFMQMPNK